MFSQTCVISGSMDFFLALLIFCSFLLSASCGMGGSLLLIPGLSMALGIKEGIVTASILLALNNCIKLFFYRNSLRFRLIWVLGIVMGIGAFTGALVLFSVSDDLLALFLFAQIILCFISDIMQRNIQLRKSIGIFFAAMSGFCSGISGMGGPLKGMAVKSWVIDKGSGVAAVACLSLVTDVVKTGVYLSKFSPQWLTTQWILFCLCMMPVATALGRNLNNRMSTKAYNTLFYFVLSGYVFRLFF